MAAQLEVCPDATGFGEQVTVPPASGLETVVIVNAWVSVLMNWAEGASPNSPVCRTSGGVPTQVNPAGAAGRLIWRYVQSFGLPVTVSADAPPNPKAGVVPSKAVNVIVVAGVAKVAAVHVMPYVKSPTTTGSTAGAGLVST